MLTHTATVWHAPADEADRFLPEGPRVILWQGRSAVLWVNIQTAPEATSGSLLLKFLDTGEVVRFTLPGRPGFVVPTRQPGEVVIGLTKQVGLFDLTSRTWTPLVDLPDCNPRTIINDGEPLDENAEAIVFGTKDTQFREPLGALYLFTRQPTPQVTLLRDQQTCSNGKVLHAATDGGILVYDIDTPTKQVTRNRLDLATRTLQAEGVALDLSHEPDFPDGMIDGGSGSVIIAFYNPSEDATSGRAVRYDLATGQALETWVTPLSPRVTCPLMLPTPSGAKLLLTTCDEGMTPALRQRCPHAGCLFLADLA